MAVTPEFVQEVSEALDELGYSVEEEHDVITDVDELDDDVTLPAIRVQGETMTGYVSMKLAVLVSYIDKVIDELAPVHYATNQICEDIVDELI
jgi:hypothetical protein